jgi:hypothetical protein
LFFVIQISEKLNKNNHALWRPQVLAAIRGARLEGHINGKTPAPPAEIDIKKGDDVLKEPNPTYDEWFALDQQILGFIFTSVTKEILGQIAASTTAAEAWAGIGDIFATHTRA